jgi:hypothetical protein
VRFGLGGEHAQMNSFSAHNETRLPFVVAFAGAWHRFAATENSVHVVNLPCCLAKIVDGCVERIAINVINHLWRRAALQRPNKPVQHHWLSVN